MSKPSRHRFLPDTSTLVAHFCSWHEQHGQATAELQRRLERGEAMILASHALLEAYSVLTRLPSPYRVAAIDAVSMLDAAIARAHGVVALDASAHIDLLRAAPERGIAGGRTYDAVIAACARQAGARFLLTFNAGHFQSLVDETTEVIVPSASR